MKQPTLTDPSTWPPLADLEPGFDVNKASPTEDLVSTTVSVVDDRGTRITHSFEETTVLWVYEPGASDDTAPAAETDEYEAVQVDDQLYFVQVRHRYLPREAVSLVLDLYAGRALAITSVLGDASPDRTAVEHVVVPARIEGGEARGAPPAPTTALVGKRALWVYSPVHAYEHVYLSPQWYTWHCLAGPELGLADTDQCSAWQVRPGIHVFAWREKVIPCGAVTIADHREPRALRSHGVLFGADEAGTGQTHFTFGAFGQVLSSTLYPADYDPALRQGG